MHGERAFGPDHVIRTEHLIRNGELRRDALANLFVVPASGLEPAALGFGRTSHADRHIEMTRPVGLKQQRYHGHGGRTAFGTPHIELGLPEGANAGMQGLFQFASGIGIREHAPGQGVAAQTATVIDHLSTKMLHDFSQGRLARLDDLARDEIRIDHRQTALAQQVGGGGFAHADAAGQSEGFH